jgi:hypothetical protein
MTGIMMATVRYVASGAGHTKSQAAWFLFHRVYIHYFCQIMIKLRTASQLSMNASHINVNRKSAQPVRH